MSTITLLQRLCAAVLALAVVLVPNVSTQAADEADFYRAYYLEHAAGQTEAAFELYAAVAKSGRASEEVRTEAKQRATALAEDLAASDFARLVPHDTIFYAELSRPGDQLASLLAQLGLLGKVSGSDPSAFGVSPLLVESALGMRGAAVAVTSVELQGGMPSGVMILHPGNLDLVRGMLETALPAGGAPVAAIDGHPTWQVEKQVFVTLTSRLVIASPDPAQIEGVLGRLAGDNDDSLADNPNVQNALAARGDGLLTFCLNAEPILPMVKWMIEQQAQGDPEAAMALSFLDIDSLRCVSGHLGIDDTGLDFEVALELAAGHRNLVFNLMRQQPVGPETLQMVPTGAAFFLAGAYNPAGPVAPIMKDSAGQPVVTFMDFGRELFGNLIDVAVYGLPSEGTGSGGQIPEIAAVVRSNDPERTQAVIGLLMDAATQGSSGGRLRPEAAEIAGVAAVQYNLGGVPIYVASEGGRVLVSPSRNAIAQSVDAGQGRGSVLDDTLYTDALRGMANDTTFLMMANAGRCARMAAPYIPPGEAAQIQPYLGMIEETVVATDVEHSETRLAFRTQLRNVPDIGPAVAQLLQAQRGGMSSAPVARRTSEARRPAAVSTERPAPAPRPETSAVVEGKSSMGDLRQRFDDLAVKKGMEDQAEALGRQLVDVAGKDAMALNNYSWALLTEERYGHRFDSLALEVATRANELSRFENWIYLDTLAHALFFEDHVAEAIDLEKKAIQLAGSDARRGEAEEALARFVAAARPTAEAVGQPSTTADTAAAAEAELQRKADEVAAKAKAARAAKKEQQPPAPAKAKEKSETIASPVATSSDAPSLQREFEGLVEKGADRKELEALGQKILSTAGRDAQFLNDFAWSLLTEERYDHRFDELALDVSMRSNKLTKFENWLLVDTLAHAVFHNGDVEGAIDLEQKAIELGGTDPRIGEAKAALEKFLAARPKAEEVSAPEPAPEPAAPVVAPEVTPEPVPEPAPKTAPAAAPVSPDPVALRREFDALVQAGASHADVKAAGTKVFHAVRDDAGFLNAFAWELLTEEVYGHEFDDLALDLAMRANKLERFQNWYYVDTLAHAVFQSGDLEGAIGLEQTAIELAGQDERRGEAEASLARFQTALEAQTAGTR